MPRLCVNIDHVATIRQARMTYEPDPVQAAHDAVLGGADGITVHLREDRRHIQDEDVRRLAEVVTVELNLEMAATDEMVAIAGSIRPHMAMLVPEGRLEITTEGGLDVAADQERLADIVARLRDAGIGTSMFIDADPRQIEAAAKVGARVCEVHTGPYAHARHADSSGSDSPMSLETLRELQRVAAAGRAITDAGMAFNAGHALNYDNVGPIAALPNLQELHIGHAIISRAVFSGLSTAVGEMQSCIASGLTDDVHERTQ
ncbi:MAG TPA: pyridoxine 5'-phosphate synthase [Phycisphaerales bacterium]|nr:pyridoxine 5'-phosphate synthase [Phycisphaerales bacterium]